MKALITTPFADSRAADLRLAYGLAPLPALGAHQVSLPGARIDLRVLGASHQVVLDVGATRWSETVACLPDRPGRLPAQDTVQSGLLHARFTARCLRLAPARLSAQVHVVVRQCEGHPWALVATFPGVPLAITALLVQDLPGAMTSWRTWHAYPQTGELVRTSSVVVAR
ncbi:MAG: DUF2617 family protein [Pseudonocardiaceae bacterium]